MAFYPAELIEEVLARNDIVDVIGNYVRLQKKGNTYFGLCPFHSEKTGSFSVSPHKQLFYCFGCGVGGNALTFIQKYESFTFQEAVEVLAERTGVALPKYEMTEAQKKEAGERSILLEIQKEAGKYFYTMLRDTRGQKAYQYFKDRGLSDETMQKFGLGYAQSYSDDLYRYLKSKGYADEILKNSGLIVMDEVRGGHDKFWNRAMFPIMDVNSHVIGFGGRVMGEGEPKYLNSPETKIFDKSRNLYGLHIAKSTRKSYILLCEGYMDVIALHQAGFDNAAASLGTAFTEGHSNLLKRYTKEVYITYDSDGAGKRAALRAIPILKKSGITAKIINMQPYKDPDEFIKNLGAEEYQRRIEEAENSFLFEIRMLESGYDLEDPESKTAFFNEIAAKLLGFSEELERNNYIEAVAQKYHISFEDLRKLVNRLALKVGQISSPVERKSGIHANKKKEDGMKKSQKLLLTWLTEDTRLFALISAHISPEDFTEEIYKKAAGALFAQYQESGAVAPAKIISLFEEEEQEEVAGIFNAQIPKPENQNDMEKALKETIIRVKQNSIDYREKLADPTDIEQMMQFLEERKALQQLEKLHISIN